MRKHALGKAVSLCSHFALVSPLSARVLIHHAHGCKGLELTEARTIDCEKTENPRHFEHLNKQQCEKNLLPPAASK